MSPASRQSIDELIEEVQEVERAVIDVELGVIEGHADVVGHPGQKLRPPIDSATRS